MRDSNDSLDFEPVHKTTLVESVMEQIIALMRNGRLGLGDRLPSERTLMKMMGVGRSTVREALQGLAAMNLIETRSGQGSRVKSLPPILRDSEAGSVTATLERDLRLQLLDVRETLETRVGQWAVERASDEDIAELKRRLDDYCRPFSEEEYETQRLRTHRAFHHALAAASHNAVAVRVVDSLVSMIPASLSTKYRHYIPEELEIHRKIYEALAAREAGALRAAIVEHMNAERRQIMAG